MPPDVMALSRKAVACREWRWLPGMRWSVYQTAPLEDYHGRIDDSGRLPPSGAVPDLFDAATLGAVRSLVRAAWRCPDVYARKSSVRRVSDGLLGWEVCDLWMDEEGCRRSGADRPGSIGCWGYASEAEALVDVLDAAP